MPKRIRPNNGEDNRIFGPGDMVSVVEGDGSWTGEVEKVLSRTLHVKADEDGVIYTANKKDVTVTTPWSVRKSKLDNDIHVGAWVHVSDPDGIWEGEVKKVTAHTVYVQGTNVDDDGNATTDVWKMPKSWVQLVLTADQRIIEKAQPFDADHLPQMDDFVESIRDGRVFQVVGFGRTNVHAVDDMGRRWSIKPRGLRPTNNTIAVLNRSSAHVVVGSVVTCASAAKSAGLAADTDFVVIRVTKNTANLVVLGGNPPSVKYNYYRADIGNVVPVPVGA